MKSIKDCYINYVKNIINNGRYVHKDDGDYIIENVGNYYHIDDPLNLKYKAKYQNYTSDMLLKDIKEGIYDVQFSPIKSEALYSYLKSIHSYYDLNFVYSYPNRLISHFGINQLSTIVNRIVNNLTSNRAIAVTLDPVQDSNEKDIPCLQVVQVLVRNEDLQLHVYFRSNDAFGGFYSNMFFLSYLGMVLSEEINKKLIRNKVFFNQIFYYCSSGHIYKNDVESAKKLIKNKERCI